MPTSSRNTSTSRQSKGTRFCFLLNSEADQVTALVMMCVVSLFFLTFFFISAQTFSCRRKPLKIESAAPSIPANAGPASAFGSSYLVDINTAGIHELSILPGVGEVTARKIVAERNANGPFRSTEDLRRVHGIGNKKIEALESMVAPIAGSSLAEAPQVTVPLTQPAS